MPIYNLAYGIQTTPPGPTPWTPGANTVAYYPLNSTTTVNDESGNNYNLTNNNAVFSSLGCKVGNSAYLSRNILQDAGFVGISGSNSRTISVWAKASSGWTSDGYPYFIGYNYTYQAWAMLFYIRSNLYGVDAWGSGSGIRLSMYNDYDDWHLTTITAENTGSSVVALKVYLDGELYGSKNNVNMDTGTTYFIVGKDPEYNAYFDGYVSELIIENKVRTAQEIADYYDQTKANYGL